VQHERGNSRIPWGFEFLPEVAMWNREKYFPLKYGDKNLVLGKKSTRRITSFNNKCMELFEEF
jgi:hypothetical protein